MVLFCLCSLTSVVLVGALHFRYGFCFLNSRQISEKRIKKRKKKIAPPHQIVSLLQELMWEPPSKAASGFYIHWKGSWFILSTVSDGNQCVGHCNVAVSRSIHLSCFSCDYYSSSGDFREMFLTWHGDKIG